jgi:predicted ATP-grasp superfamily ATP-dependent carboligase
MQTDLGGKDDEAIVAKINHFCVSAPNALLVPVDCDGARCFNRMRDHLSIDAIPTPDNRMLDCFNDKWSFYQFCRQHGLNVPTSRFARDKHELDYASTAATLGLPFVIKPLSEDSSRGICIISSEEHYRKHVLDNPDYRHAPLIVQRHIEGIDVGLNLLCRNGNVEALAIQQRIDPGHDGSRIKFFSNSYLENAARVLARESSYHGVMNIDARIESGTGKVYFFESNPRLWRSLSASVWCGLNFLAEGAASTSAGGIKRLVSGDADTYYHPLFRPSLWPCILFDSGPRGRMVRAMMLDMCTLSLSTRILSVRIWRSMKRNAQMMFSRFRENGDASDFNQKNRALVLENGPRLRE